MTIIEQLNKWSEKTGGTAETVSTITLNTEQMNLVVHGVSLEDAYEKIKEVCSDFNTEAKEETEVKEAEQPREAAVIEQTKADDDSDGTWIVSTTMGGVFTKYVFICSKCGYKKESVFSMTPLSYCPECEKKKAGMA